MCQAAETPGRAKRIARTRSNLAMELSGMDLDVAADASQSLVPQRSHTSNLAASPSISQSGSRLSKRQSVPSDVLHQMAFEAESLAHQGSLAPQGSIGESAREDITERSFMLGQSGPESIHNASEAVHDLIWAQNARLAWLACCISCRWGPTWTTFLIYTFLHSTKVPHGICMPDDTGKCCPMKLLYSSTPPCRSHSSHQAVLPSISGFCTMVSRALFPVTRRRICP